MNRDISQCDGIETQYSIIPVFHYSNCERSELSSIMEIEIVAAESLGVRSLCCVVNTRGRKILIDPGVALGYTRFRLLPHPLQVAVDERIQRRIIHEWATATDIVISHFHGDHVPLANANPYQLAIEKVAPLNPDAVIWAKASQLSPTEMKRARAFSIALNNHIIAAEGKSGGILRFSQPVPHGKAKGLERVVMTKIEEDFAFVHASDIQLLNDEAISQIVSWRPDIVLVSGPPLYLHKLSEDDAEKAWHNAIRLSQKVATLIIDHHLLRDFEGAGWLARLCLKAPGNVICGADFMGKPRMLLEAQRPQLYEEMQVPEDWHDSYAQGRARTDQYCNMAKELYEKKGLDHYKWVNEACL
jgi:predicted metallo-beta-lactamase superfamily hydrolase